MVHIFWNLYVIVLLVGLNGALKRGLIWDSPLYDMNTIGL